MRHTTTKQNKGFVVLFTALIASIVLAIALGIASVSYREVLLSSTANDAAYSFFAADTGAECALYWDIQQTAFTQSLVVPDCGGASVEMISSSSPFKFRFPTGVSGCAIVTVDKSDPTVTKIESLGYNASCQALDLTQGGTRIVERAIRVTYGPGQAPDTNAADEVSSTQSSTTRNPPASPDSFSSERTAPSGSDFTSLEAVRTAETAKPQ